MISLSINGHNIAGLTLDIFLASLASARLVGDLGPKFGWEKALGVGSSGRRRAVRAHLARRLRVADSRFSLTRHNHADCEQIKSNH